MRIRYPSAAPFPVDIPSLGATDVAPGDVVDAPKALAEQLIAQGFERVEPVKKSQEE